MSEFEHMCDGDHGGKHYEREERTTVTSDRLNKSYKLQLFTCKPKMFPFGSFVRLKENACHAIVLN